MVLMVWILIWLFSEVCVRACFIVADVIGQLNEETRSSLESSVLNSQHFFRMKAAGSMLRALRRLPVWMPRASGAHDAQPKRRLDRIRTITI